MKPSLQTMDSFMINRLGTKYETPIINLKPYVTCVHISSNVNSFCFDPARSKQFDLIQFNLMGICK